MGQTAGFAAGSWIVRQAASNSPDRDRRMRSRFSAWSKPVSPVYEPLPLSPWTSPVLTFVGRCTPLRRSLT
jgi:hypothetical protein